MPDDENNVLSAERAPSTLEYQKPARPSLSTWERSLQFAWASMVALIGIATLGGGITQLWLKTRGEVGGTAMGGVHVGFAVVVLTFAVREFRKGLRP